MDLKALQKVKNIFPKERAQIGACKWVKINNIKKRWANLGDDEVGKIVE